MRIFYLIPGSNKSTRLKSIVNSLVKFDFYSLKSFLRKENISGGVKVLFQHCDLLNQLGFQAHPVLFGYSAPGWFSYNTHPVFLRDIGYELKKTDIVVCPECMPYEGLKFKNSKKIIFVQNWAGATAQLNWLKPQDLSGSYYKLGYGKILSVSNYVTDFLRNHGKGEAITVANCIDINKFRYEPGLKQENRVLWLSRKNSKDARKIISVVRKKNTDANFVKVDYLTEDQIIKEYQKADIFLATGYPEGFAMPALEAMACGCVVVGFTGGGAAEFMIDNQNSLIAPDGDCEAVAQKLIRILENKELKEYLRLNGIKKSQEYNYERCKRELKDFYDGLAE